MPTELIPESLLLALLRQVNPWWSGKPVAGLPETTRAAVAPLWGRLSKSTTSDATLLTGARCIGKTTIVLQLVREMIYGGVAPEQIVYINFDHPVFKAAGLGAALKAWLHATPKRGTTLYLVLDEVQYGGGWEEWPALRGELPKNHHIIAAQSARPKRPTADGQVETPWEIVRLGALTFREYLEATDAAIPPVPDVASLRVLMDWQKEDFNRTAAVAEPLVAHFNELLVRGGFPETIRAESVEDAQAYLHQEIVDRALKCDLTALYGVRRIAELESLFLHLCMNDASVVDLQATSSALNISKNTLRSHLEMLQASNLIQCLPQFGYGTEVLRGKDKAYLLDPALGLGITMGGREALENSRCVAAAVEGFVFKHLANRYAVNGPAFSYWRGKNGEEVSIVATGAAQSRPFAVCYSDAPIDQASLKGLRRFCRDKGVGAAYVITKRLSDFGPIELREPERSGTPLATRCLMIPALLFCFWMSEPSIPDTAPPAGWYKGLPR